MMNKKELRELDYEKEMQAQAEYMSRWKLRKEIKKKLRALRKKIKTDEASLPHLKTISRRLDDVEKPLEPCVRENPEPMPKLNFCEKNPIVIWQPCHTEHYSRVFVCDPRMVINPSGGRIEDIILKQMGEEFGYELLKAGAIQYKIYDNRIMDIKQVEMKVDVVIEDILRENPAKYVNSPTLPIRKCPG